MRHPVTSRNFSELISRVKQGGSVAERAAHIVNFLRLSTFLQPISRMHSWKENASFSHMLIRIGAAATYTTYLPTYHYILRTYCSGQGLHKQSKNEKLDLSPESQKSMKYCNSFQLLCTCKNPVVLTVKACRLGIRQENFFHL